jgi:hypothetical protein
MKRYIVESDFTYEGLRCVVLFQMLGYRCGYVGVPKVHELYGKDYDDVYDKLEDGVHGGLTYAGGGEESEYPVESNLWWLGFDCAHYGDGKDLDLAKEYFKEDEKIVKQLEMTAQIESMYPIYEPVRSLQYVENECKSLVNQINKSCGKVGE